MMIASIDISGLLDPANAAVLWRVLGRLHPMVVHFPLALIIVAAILESMLFFRRGRRVSRTAVTCLVIGAVLAAFAAWCGWLNADHEVHEDSMAFTLTLHRWIGIAAAGTACLALMFGLPARFRAEWAVLFYRWFLLIAAGLVAVGGFYGAELVYGRGYLAAAFETPGPEPVEPVQVAMIDEPVAEPIHEPPPPPVVAPVVPVEPEPAPVVAPEPEPAPQPEPVVVPEPEPQPQPEPQPAPEPQPEPKPVPAPPPPPAPEPGPKPEPKPEPKPAPKPEPESDPAAAAKDRAIEAIRARGGIVTLLNDDGDEIEVSFHKTEPIVTDDDLELLADLKPWLTRLNLAGTAVTDAAVNDIAALARLEQVNLWQTHLSATGMALLQRLRADLEIVTTEPAPPPAPVP